MIYSSKTSMIKKIIKYNEDSIAVAFGLGEILIYNLKTE